MSEEFRGIRPEDMTKLQQIIEMMSRGSSTYARKIAESIDEPVAHNVAQILVRTAIKPRPEYVEFADQLTASTRDLVKRVAVA